MSIAGNDPGVFCDGIEVYHGSVHHEKAREEDQYNNQTFDRIEIIRTLLSQMGYYDASPEEKKKEEGWKTKILETLGEWAGLCQGRSEKLGGCYGADLWALCSITQNRVRLHKEISYPEIHDLLIKEHNSDPSLIYWIEPHDPRKEKEYQRRTYRPSRIIRTIEESYECISCSDTFETLSAAEECCDPSG